MARYQLIACEILLRECCHFIARSPHVIDVAFLPKGLHDVGKKLMQQRLAEQIAAVDTANYDAILLGYALCNGGIVGLTAPDIPLVVPKAHDCITLFLGHRDRYLQYFHQNPGCYFKTVGWIERGGDLQPFGDISTPTKKSTTRQQSSLEELVAKYGEDNGHYLWNQLTQMANYSKMTFIETGIEPSDDYEKETVAAAASRGWKFEKLQGDLMLFSKLLAGRWDDDFLVVPPGQSIDFSFMEDVICCGST